MSIFINLITLSRIFFGAMILFFNKGRNVLIGIYIFFLLPVLQTILMDIWQENITLSHRLEKY